MREPEIAPGARTTEQLALQVVVVAYGPPGNLHEALGALGGAFPVTIVDNSSSDEVRGLAERTGARYVDPRSNLGFAAAVNLGLSGLPTDSGDVLLLNPDARILRADVEQLRLALEELPDTACVAPSHRFPDSTKSLSPWLPWNTPLGAWAEAAGLHRLRGPGFLSGAVLLLNGRAVRDVGTLDERFFLYAEDEDWQKRALARGWKLRHCGGAVAVHASGGTDHDLARRRARLHAAVERYVRKWYGTVGWAVYRSGVVTGQCLRLAVYGCLRRRQAARRSAAALLRIYLSGPDRWATRSGAVPERPGKEHRRGARSSGS